MDTEPRDKKPPPVDAFLRSRLALEIKAVEETYRLNGPEDKRPPKKYWPRNRNPTREDWQDACDRANFDLRCKVTKAFCARAEKAVRNLKDQNFGYLGEEADSQWFPQPWMLKDFVKIDGKKVFQIREMLERTRWADVFNDLLKNATMESSQELAECLPKENRHFRKNGKEYFLILTTANPAEMAARLDVPPNRTMSPQSVSLYVQRFTENEFVQEVGRTPGSQEGRFTQLGIGRNITTLCSK
jgi:hypothetical protein